MTQDRDDFVLECIVRRRAEELALTLALRWTLTEYWDCTDAILTIRP